RRRLKARRDLAEFRLHRSKLGYGIRFIVVAQCADRLLGDAYLLLRSERLSVYFKCFALNLREAALQNNALSGRGEAPFGQGSDSLEFALNQSTVFGNCVALSLERVQLF